MQLNFYDFKHILIFLIFPERVRNFLFFLNLFINQGKSKNINCFTGYTTVVIVRILIVANERCIWVRDMKKNCQTRLDVKKIFLSIKDKIWNHQILHFYYTTMEEKMICVQSGKLFWKNIQTKRYFIILIYW